MAAKTKRTHRIIRLKVTLRDVRPAVWRRLELPANLTLGDLHRVIQGAMGWTDSHLHQFIKDGVFYGRPFEDMDVVDERRVRISDVLIAGPRQRMVYEYDFGDSWQHDVVLEGETTAPAGVRNPRVVDGARACPPEDVGGVPYYEEFLRAMRNPRHPEHADNVEWLGGPFDPEAFDLEAANRSLRR